MWNAHPGPGRVSEATMIGIANLQAKPAGGQLLEHELVSRISCQAMHTKYMTW